MCLCVSVHVLVPHVSVHSHYLSVLCIGLNLLGLMTRTQACGRPCQRGACRTMHKKTGLYNPVTDQLTDYKYTTLKTHMLVSLLCSTELSCLADLHV